MVNATNYPAIVRLILALNDCLAKSPEVLEALIDLEQDGHSFESLLLRSNGIGLVLGGLTANDAQAKSQHRWTATFTLIGDRFTVSYPQDPYH